MHQLDHNEVAVLELLALRPLSFFPPPLHILARRLARSGLVAFTSGQWHLTAEGAALTAWPLQKAA
jgi:hypothetical protein